MNNTADINYFKDPLANKTGEEAFKNRLPSILESHEENIKRLGTQYVFDTIADAQAYSGFVEGDIIEVLGYYEKGDGAGHKRKKTSTGWDYIVEEVKSSWIGALNSASNITSEINSIYEKTIVIDKDFLLTANTQIKKLVYAGGKIYTNSNIIITIDEIEDTKEKLWVLSNGNSIKLNQDWARPDWWGNINETLNFSENALPNNGGTIYLSNKRYKDNFHKAGLVGSYKCFTKDNVKIIGEGMPSSVFNYTKLADGTGSIVDGMLLFSASGCYYEGFGVDSGIDYLNARNGGVVIPAEIGEGILTGPPNLTDYTKVPTNITFGNVVGLCARPNDPVHSFMIGENVEQVKTFGTVKGIYGQHGIVIKCASVKCERVESYCNGQDGIIFKSGTDLRNKVSGVTIDSVFTNANGELGKTPYLLPTSTDSMGVFFNNNSTMSDIIIGKLESYGYYHPIRFDSSSVNEITINVAIGICNITGKGKSLAGSVGLNFIKGKYQNILINTLEIINVKTALASALTNFSSIVINNLDLKNVEKGVYNENSNLIIDNIFTSYEVNTLFDVLRNFYVGKIIEKSTISTTKYLTAPFVFKNGWSDMGAGNPPLVAELVGKKKRLYGMVKPSINNITVLTLSSLFYPKDVIFSMGNGISGTTFSPVPFYIDTTGNLVINPQGGVGIGNCSTYLFINIIYE